MKIGPIQLRKAAGPAERRAVRPSCIGKRERGALIIDCRGCRQKQDLADPRCLKGIIRIMASEAPGIREIILSRDWEIIYDQDCVDALSAISDIVRFANSIQFHQPFEDCATCLSNPRTVIARMVDGLPRAAPEMDASFARPSGGHGRACEQCIRTLRSNMDHARHLLDLAETRINKAAFKVVSSNDH